MNSSAAELMGIMLGDGNIYVNRARSIYAVRISLGLDEQPYAEFIRMLFVKTFNVTPKITHYKKNGSPSELILLIYSKALVEELMILGLVPGDKVKNNVGMPAWIKENVELLKACIRGLIDTDGCVYKKYGSTAPQIEFYSKSMQLVSDARLGLLALGFKVSKIIHGKRVTPKFGIYGRTEVERYVDCVGFSNEKYRTRFKNIQAHSF